MIRTVAGISFLALFFIATVSAQTGVTSLSTSAALVSVANVTSYPEVYYPGEEGTITVTLQNFANQSVGVSQPDIIGANVHVVNANTFQTLSYIGPGSTLAVSFDVIIDGPDGTYFPLFTIGTKDASSIHFPVKIIVDSTDLQAGISSKPDNFAISRMDTVNLSLINPRDGPINNIIVSASGPGLDITPTESFVSSLDAGNSVILPFSVTPNQQTNMTFHIEYENGDNKHAQDVVLPINIGPDKTGSNPVVNNIALTSQDGYYEMTGDVNNAGISDAEAMVITVLPPAHPVEPYTSYAIGTLASDDFSSFTLTFSASDLSSIPVQVQWKDLQGNTFTSETPIDLRTLAAGLTTGRGGSSGSTSSGGGSSASTGGGPGGGGPRGGGFFSFGGGSRGGGLGAFDPVILGAVIIVAAVLIYAKRKWIMARIQRKQ